MTSPAVSVHRMRHYPDTRARRLATALEPFAAQVYFAPDCHERYEALGFGGSRGGVGSVQMPDGPAYFCSRGSCLGQVPGEVVAAAFAVFNPAVVVPAVRAGWTKTDSSTINGARTEGSVAHLRRILGDSPEGLTEARSLLERAGRDLRPEGRSLYAGMLSLDLPDHPLGVAWRLADRLREYRGDAHIACWVAAGLDATEIGLLTELYWGLPLRTYIRTRAWSDTDLDAAEERLNSRALTANGSFTEEGRRLRESIEEATDAQCEAILEALDEDFDTLVEILSSWSAKVQEQQGYPVSGPHDLARTR